MFDSDQSRNDAKTCGRLTTISLAPTAKVNKSSLPPHYSSSSGIQLVNAILKIRVR